MRPNEEEDEDEATGEEGMMVETEETDKEVADILEVSLGMVVDGEGEGEGVGTGTLRALGSIDFLTQDANPSGTTLVDARNGFNKMSRLEMLWTVCHCWLAGARSVFNCYSHWAQLLLCHPGEPPVTILILEGLTQGDPLSMVLYGISLVPLVKELKVADLGLLSPFYANDAEFNRLSRQSAQLLNLLMERGPDRGYLPKPAKSLFIPDTPVQEEAARREFAAEGLVLNFLSGG